MSVVSKQVEVRLFFNRSNNSFYVMLGDQLFIINDKVATRISEKQGLEIKHGHDIKEIQEMCNEKSE